MNSQNNTNQTLQARCDKLQRENIALIRDNQYLQYINKILTEAIKEMTAANDVNLPINQDININK